MKQLFIFLLAIVTIAISGCSKATDGNNSIQLTLSDQTMHFDDEFQINATSGTPITYSSDNEYHAEVSASGLVTAGRIGETNIVLTNGNDTKRIKITVTPESNLYPEPDLTFGMTRSAVKTKLGIPDSETETGMGYTGWSYASDIMMCLFDENDKLTTYAVMVKTSYTSDLTEFLLERYVPAALPDDGDIIAIFVNGLDMDTANMAVSLSLYNLSYLMILYSKFPSANTRSAENRSDIISSIDELMSE